MAMLIVVSMDLSDKQPEEPGGSWIPVFPGNEALLTRSQARIWALVLDSRAVPCCIAPAGNGWHLLVPEHQMESARRELSLFEKANQDWPPAVPATRQLAENTLPTISILLLLATFHNLTLVGLSLPGHGILDLYDLGAAHSAGIREGEWWRCFTALTLHSGPVHLLSNLVIGGTFIVLLCRELGSGIAWSLLLASGALGNLLNAWMQSPAHRSVGASTAVFGAVGILAAISMVRYRHHLQRRWFVPVAAGVALLAILGTEGKQTDLGAHLFGFGIGLLVGITAELLVGKYGRPGGVINRMLAVLSASATTAAWWAAIHFGTQ